MTDRELMELREALVQEYKNRGRKKREAVRRARHLRRREKREKHLEHQREQQRVAHDHREDRRRERRFHDETASPCRGTFTRAELRWLANVAREARGTA